MRASDAESRLVLPACILSLALYVCFSRLSRLWIKGLAYHRDLLLGVAPQIRTHLWHFYNSILSPKAWNPVALVQMAAVIGLCILAAELTRRILGGHLSRFPAIPLFAFGYAVIPQSLMALLLWPDGRGHLTAINEILLLGAAVVLQSILLIAGRRLKGDENPPAPSQSSLGIWGYVFVAPTALLLTVSLLAGMQMIGGSDALGYHLPLAASLLSTGRTATGPDWQFLYPANPELAIRWFLTPGNDRLADLIPFLTALFSMSTLYQICRTIGQTSQSAAVSACCLISVPFVSHLATSAYTDLCASMFILMSAFYLCECWQTGWRDKPRVFCCGLALGLGLGSKYTVIPGALLIFGCCLFSLVNDGLNVELSKAEAAKLLPSSSKRKIWLFGLSILPGCLYWFIRNGALFGNPLYPVAVFGLPGYPLKYFVSFDSQLQGRLWTQLAYPWVEGDFAGPVDFYSYGVGAVLAGIVVPLALWWPIHMIRSRRFQAHRKERWFLYSLALAFLLSFLSQQTMVTRYAVLAILLMFFLVGEGWEHLRSVAFRVVVGVAFLMMCAGLAESQVGGILYRLALGPRQGIARFYVPPEIDRLPPSVILNAAGGPYTYGLMASDYRHRVIWLASECAPDDAVRFRVQYVFLRASDLPRYSATLNLQGISTSRTREGEDLVLCRLTGVRSSEAPRP